jgi:hypothetical protein
MPPKSASSSQGTKLSQGTPSSTTQPATTITYTAIIDHIADLCGFAKDSTIMQIIAQQRWSELSDVTTLTMDKVGDLTLFKSDGTYWAIPIAHHVRKLWCFLPLYS